MNSDGTSEIGDAMSQAIVHLNWNEGRTAPTSNMEDEKDEDEIPTTIGSEPISDLCP